MPPRRRFLLSALALVAVTLAACSQSSSAPVPTKPASGATQAPASGSAAKPSGGQQAQAPAQPVEIRIGHGFAAEENLWLMTARPDLTPNQGRAYTLSFTAFRANTDRLSAYEAGQLDGGTMPAPTGLFAAEQGLPFKLVASIARERQGAFNTTYLALEESGIRGPADARGKTIGIVDFKSATDLWARAALESAGLNPERDANYVVVPFPAMGEALRARRIDVGVFPEPFVTVEKRRGGVVETWTSKTGVPFEEELLDIFLRPEFIERNREAVRAFLADFVAVNRWYLDNRDEARRLLVEKGLIQTPIDVYLATDDYYRDPGARLTLDGLAQLQDLHMKLGWQARRVNISDIVDTTLLPQ